MVDMIFTLKQVQEKYREQQRFLYAVFIDFTKAFDSVSREPLWIILGRYCVPPHLVKLIQQFYIWMEAHISSKGQLSPPFAINNGVKQGCVLAPTLFSIYLAAVLDEAFSDTTQGIYLQTRPGANLFNLALFKSKSRTQLTTLRELMYADDTALIAHSLEDMTLDCV